MTEQWLCHPVHTAYEVSTGGRVRSIERTVIRSDGRRRTFSGRELTVRIDSEGYPTVSITKRNVMTKIRVHVLVCETFHGLKPTAAHEVRHLNGNRSQSHASNLQWGTRSENVRDAVNHGTHNHIRKTHCVNGHEFTPENTIRRAKGTRQCRVCYLAYHKRYNATRAAS
jgi:hypothetical protein